MDWTEIPWTSISMVIALAIGLPFALRARKKGGPRKAEELFNHLKELHVDVVLVAGDTQENKIGIARTSGQRCEGTFKINNKNIDYINVVSITGQYGVNYFVDYLVHSPGRMGSTDRKQTKLSMKKDSFIKGKIVDVEWRGDHYLSQVLNLDYKIKDILLISELDKLQDGINIYPEPKHEYARIRTVYGLPSSDLFTAINYIAKHVASEW
jgi:hypothetical protein